jgi:hypothetical protein
MVPLMLQRTASWLVLVPGILAQPLVLAQVQPPVALQARRAVALQAQPQTTWSLLVA